MRTFRAAPRAARLIEAMRDIGYSLETAVADLVDNSIAAGATTIHVYADIGTSAPRFAVLDDGKGMTEAELLTAMQMGCLNPRAVRVATDLGRFGLGLKTASFSQCRRLTVVTCQDGTTSVARWDLDYVTQTDDWLVQVPEGSGSVPWADQLEATGTLVVWENLDRLLEKDRQNRGKSHIVRRVDDMCQHLELVFNRYLSGEPGLHRVRIYVNERRLEAFDPFYKTHLATIIGAHEIIRVDGEDVRVQAFTLPHHRHLRRHDWERLGGAGGYVKNQGFYVYREKRLIVHGTWFGLARQTELTKLVRVRVDIPNSLDTRWKIDVKKASAQLPLQVRTRLRTIIEPIVAGSKRIYTTRGKKLVGENPHPVWSRIKKGDQIKYRLNPDNPVMAAFAKRLPASMRLEFMHILEIAGTSLPIDTLFVDITGQPQGMDGDSASKESLEYFAKTTYEHLVAAGYPIEVVRAMIAAAEPCRLDPGRTEKILNQIAGMSSDD